MPANALDETIYWCKTMQFTMFGLAFGRIGNPNWKGKPFFCVSRTSDVWWVQSWKIYEFQLFIGVLYLSQSNAYTATTQNTIFSRYLSHSRSLSSVPNATLQRSWIIHTHDNIFIYINCSMCGHKMKFNAIWPEVVHTLTLYWGLHCTKN